MGFNRKNLRPHFDTAGAFLFFLPFFSNFDDQEVGTTRHPALSHARTHIHRTQASLALHGRPQAAENCWESSRGVRGTPGGQNVFTAFGITSSSATREEVGNECQESEGIARPNRGGGAMVHGWVAQRTDRNGLQKPIGTYIYMGIFNKRSAGDTRPSRDQMHETKCVAHQTHANSRLLDETDKSP